MGADLSVWTQGEKNGAVTEPNKGGLLGWLRRLFGAK